MSTFTSPLVSAVTWLLGGPLGIALAPRFLGLVICWSVPAVIGSVAAIFTPPTWTFFGTALLAGFGGCIGLAASNLATRRTAEHFAALPARASTSLATVLTSGARWTTLAAVVFVASHTFALPRAGVAALLAAIDPTITLPAMPPDMPGPRVLACFALAQVAFAPGAYWSTVAVHLGLREVWPSAGGLGVALATCTAFAALCAGVAIAVALAIVALLPLREAVWAQFALPAYAFLLVFAGRATVRRRFEQLGTDALPETNLEGAGA